MSQLESILEGTTAQFADKRIYYCDLTANEQNGSIMLTGAVLDKETITAVSDHLRTNLSTHNIDSSQVTILRKTEPILLHVSTTITSLHNDPSWRSEQTTQLLNGQAVELLQEKGTWAFIRQMDGYLGWIYRPYISDATPPQNEYWVYEPVALLKDKPTPDAKLVSRVLGGTAVFVQDTQNGWAKIELVGGLTGWLPAEQLRPQNSQPKDEHALRAQMIADAHTLMGVPYLWGGSSAYGIDCSGFAQLIHRLSGMTLLRDADMQMENGRVVASNYQPGDLFFFGDSGGHRRVSHVGISLGGWEMIHASRSKNGVYIDNVQAVDHLRDSFLGARTYLA